MKEYLPSTYIIVGIIIAMVVIGIVNLIEIIMEFFK